MKTTELVPCKRKCIRTLQNIFLREVKGIWYAEYYSARVSFGEGKLHYNSGTRISFRAYIYALLTKREVKMAGYWPSSFFAFLWTETKSRSIKTQKKNEANIQPS